MPWQNVSIVTELGRNWQLATSLAPTNAQPFRYYLVGLQNEEFVGLEIAASRDTFSGYVQQLRAYVTDGDTVVSGAYSGVPTAPGGTLRTVARVFATNRLPTLVIDRWVP